MEEGRLTYLQHRNNIAESVATAERHDRRNNGALPVFLSDVKARHDRMVELVGRMLDLHKQLPKAKCRLGNLSYRRQPGRP
jgi:hypothetical protein